MEDIKSIKEILLTLIAFGTVAGFFIDVVRNFFMDIVKLRYKNVPGKQPRIQVVMVLIVQCTTILSICNSVMEIYKSIRFNRYGSKAIFSFAMFIGLIVFITCIVYILFLINDFIEIRKMFIEYLEKGKLNQKKKELIKRYNIHMNLIMVISSLYVVGWVSALLFYFDKDMFIIFGVFGIPSLIAFIIAYSIKGVLNEIKEDKQYILYTKDKESIFCKCYLEYNEYYLIFNEGVETYILRSDIKWKNVLRDSF